MKALVFKGNLKCGEKKNQQVIDINMPHNGLSIRGLTKEVLDLDKSFIPDDNGVYVLESEDICYVGQSKNLRERLKNHFANNKINHNRIFFLHSKSDVRGYLDYMEKRLYKSMKEEGYELANGTSLDPDQDRLDNDEKKIVDVWIAEFLAFLPILGFRKEVIKKSVVESSSVSKEEEKKLDSKNIEKDETIYTRDYLRTLLKRCYYESLKSSKILTTTFDVRKEPFVNKFTKNNAQQLVNDFGETIFYIIHFDSETLRRKINQIESFMNSTAKNTVFEKLPIKNKKINPTLKSEKLDLRSELIKELKSLKLEDIRSIEGLISSSVDIRSEKFKNRYTNAESKFFENNYGEIIHYSLNISRNDLQKKIDKIKNLKK